jgi:integration host factor subunit beta
MATRSHLIEVVAGELRLPTERTEAIVRQVFAAMTEALLRGEGVEIRGFGSFTLRQYRAYRGRNPRTGAAVEVRPKRLPFFRTGKELRERIMAPKV